MRLSSGLLVAVTIIGSSAAMGQGSANGPIVDAAQPAGDRSGTSITTQEANQPRSAEGTQETWRYRRHDGLWWYWLPANKWVYWTDGQWTNYDAKTYAEYKAAHAPRAQSSSGVVNRSGGWGQWGPIHYDRFGNPQYPYSQRSSGLRQLGPVPTPAGVRSLPGWGGER